jgi:hypothetical protein
VLLEQLQRQGVLEDLGRKTLDVLRRVLANLAQEGAIQRQGFDAEILKESGFTGEILKESGFAAGDILKESGFAARVLLPDTTPAARFAPAAGTQRRRKRSKK